MSRGFLECLGNERVSDFGAAGEVAVAEIGCTGGDGE